MPRDGAGVEMRTWIGMRQRCNNPNSRTWKDYGGRGIQVKFGSFEQFLADVGKRPDGMTVERIDNDGHYEPGNVRWATRKEQQRNRRNPVFVEIDGSRYRALDLVERYGLRHDVIKERAIRGLPFAMVVSKEKLLDLSGLALGGHAFGAKARARTHCIHGHEFTPENTRITPEGWRNCRTCQRLKMRRRYALKGGEV
jgi:hypothetical protein